MQKYIQKHNILWKHLTENSNARLLLRRQKIIKSWKENQQMAMCLQSLYVTKREIKANLKYYSINKLDWKQFLHYTLPFTHSNPAI